MMINKHISKSLFSLLNFLFFGFFSLSCLASSVNDSLRIATQSLAVGNFENLERVENYSRSVVTNEPKSSLAHWLRAQSLFVLAGVGFEYDKSDNQMIEEAIVRSIPIPEDKLPLNIVGLSEDSYPLKTILLMETSAKRLFVYQIMKSGDLRLIETFYSSIGLLGDNKSKEGDQKTPIGVYRLIKEIKNPKKIRSDGLYGRLAITLDYPNAHDKNFGRTGHGIWIHGVPDDVHVRSPKASDGCLALSNNDIEKLKKYVNYGKTHILIVSKVSWIEKEEWKTKNTMISNLFEKNLNNERKNSLLVYFRVSNKRPSVSLMMTKKNIFRDYWLETSEGIKRVLTERITLKNDF